MASTVFVMILSLFFAVMHDKYGVVALSEQWIQCVCTKRIMLNKPHAINFFEASKLVTLAGQIFFCIQLWLLHGF